MTWSPFFTEVTPGPTSTTMPAPSCPRIAGNRPSGSAPERVNSSVWHTPVALISTSTSPAFGPSSVTVVTSSGLPFSNATAARTSIAVSPWSRSLVPPRMKRGGIASTNAGPTNAKGRGLRRALANPDACRMSGFRLRYDADIGLGRLPALRVLLLGVVVRHRAGDDYVLAVLPVYRRRHLVLGGKLQRVDHAQHLIKVAAGGHRIDQDELDLLVRADDEHVAYGLIVGGRAFRRIAGDGGREHAVELGDVEIHVGDHRIVGRVPLRLLDVVRPARVFVERIDGQADDLDAALVEFRLDLCHVSELGGADRREVLGMPEQHHPLVADPIVKADLPFGRLRFEIRGSIIDCESHSPPPSPGCQCLRKRNRCSGRRTQEPVFANRGSLSPRGDEIRIPSRWVRREGTSRAGRAQGKNLRAAPASRPSDALPRRAALVHRHEVSARASMVGSRS